MDEHRLKRSYPDCLSQLLSDVFETLARAHSSEPAEGPWTLETDHVASRPQSLQAIGGRLADRDQTVHSDAQDRSEANKPGGLAGTTANAS